MTTNIQQIAVLTSGGDAPGMNAAIRAVTRTALHKGWGVFGIRRGYLGLINGEFTPLGARDVGGIMQHGGTMLGRARCPEFKTEQGLKKGINQLEAHGVDALVVIGGNGSQTGAHALHQKGVPVVGVASTIDNDLLGSDITIGVDTALDVALESIDRLKITASSHHRAFLVETMGRDCGYLALMTGIAGGAEAIIVPEFEVEPRKVAVELRKSYERGKTHALVVVAEGAKHAANALASWFADHRAELGFALRVTKLGHVQRGGNPGAFDRVLATRLGAGATAALDRGESGVLTGLIGNTVTTTPLAEIVGKIKGLDQHLLELANVLAK